MLGTYLADIIMLIMSHYQKIELPWLQLEVAVLVSGIYSIFTWLGLGMPGKYMFIVNS